MFNRHDTSQLHREDASTDHLIRVGRSNLIIRLSDSGDILHSRVVQHDSDEPDERDPVLVFTSQAMLQTV